ncbi:hypothetical protein J6S55_02835, partial [Candidatus Saccharibacteria bacterium]|nr:hypothetical protein [Candidatus Saccharibacteria bacterium]
YVRCIMVKDTMQDMSSTQASSMTEGESKALRDARDGKAYSVTKINGDVWMTQNLGFTGTSLDPSTSDVASAKTITYGDLTSGNSYDQARIHDSGNSTTGVWYNFAAASAMTITGPSNSDTATESVCPKGWRLPTKNEQAGITRYSSSFNPVASGYYSEGKLNDIDLGGYWWSSTAATYSGFTGRSNLEFRYNLLTVDDGYPGIVGFSVRCIKPKPTMQDVTYADVESMSEGDTMTRPDARDGQVYTMAKINGKLWMTKNLAIGCNGSGSTYGSSVSQKTLSSADSNVSSYTTPTALLSQASSSTETADYTNGRIQCSATYGAWYNYAAASAGTVTGNSNGTGASSSICPLGWRLPTSAEFSAITSYRTAFAPVTGGRYYGGSLDLTSYGNWWSSTASDNTARYSLTYDVSSLSRGNYDRNRGLYVRCLHN